MLGNGNIKVAVKSTIRVHNMRTQTVKEQNCSYTNQGWQIRKRQNLYALYLMTTSLHDKPVQVVPKMNKQIDCIIMDICER